MKLDESKRKQYLACEVLVERIFKYGSVPDRALLIVSAKKHLSGWFLRRVCDGLQQLTRESLDDIVDKSVHQRNEALSVQEQKEKNAQETIDTLWRDNKRLHFWLICSVIINCIMLLFLSSFPQCNFKWLADCINSSWCSYGALSATLAAGGVFIFK